MNLTQAQLEAILADKEARLRELGIEQMGIGIDERTNELRLELFGNPAAKDAISKELPDVPFNVNAPIENIQLHPHRA